MKQKLYRYLFSFIVLLVTVKGYSQSFEPVFEDKEGKTSIITPRGFFGVNTANSSIRFQYFYSRSAAPDPVHPKLVGKWNRFYGGVNVAGAAPGGISYLFSNGSFNPGTAVDLFLGHRSLLFGTIDRKDRTGETVKNYSKKKGKFLTIQDWLTLRSGVQAANFKLYNPAQPFNRQVSSELFRGYVAQIAYTLLFNGSTSVGVSWDVSKANNIEDLAPVTFKEQTIIRDVSGQTTRTFEKVVTAYAGPYATFTAYTYSVDVVRFLIPGASDTKYAFHIYGRATTHSAEKMVYRAGTGFYVFPKGKLFGGAFIESNDLTNRVSATADFLKRIDIGITFKYILPSLGGASE